MGEFWVFFPLDAKNEHDSCHFAPLYGYSCFSKEANILKVGHGEHICTEYGAQVGEKSQKN